MVAGVCGCDRVKEETKRAHNEKSCLDSQAYVNQVYIGLAAAEQGYYVVVNGILYFYDNHLKKAVPVCAKPDCDHKTNRNCNANMDLFDCDIYYDGGRLYSVSSDADVNGDQFADLYEIAADGSERKKLYTIYVQPSDSDEKENGIGYSMAVDQGYAYYSFYTPAPANSRDKTVIGKVYRRELKKDAKEECIYKRNGIGTDFQLEVHGDSIYIQESFLKDTDSSKRAVNLVKWDENTEKISNVKENVETFQIIGEQLFMIQKDKIIKWNEKTGKEEVIYQGKEVESSMLLSDGAYLYLDNSMKYYWGEKKAEDNRKIKVLDTEGTLVEAFQLKNEMFFMGGDERWLFFCHNQNPLELMVYDKKNLGTGKFSTTDWITSE